jgi:hypothetical protein
MAPPESRKGADFDSDVTLVDVDIDVKALDFEIGVSSRGPGICSGQPSGRRRGWVAVEPADNVGSPMSDRVRA